jgi:hypothetical protein
MSAEATARRSQEAGTQVEASRDPRAIIGRRIGQEALKKLEELNLRYLRGVPNGWCVVLKDCDLSGLDLQSLNFSQGNFIACNFENSNLEDARLIGANLFSARASTARTSRAPISRIPIFAAPASRTRS